MTRLTFSRARATIDFHVQAKESLKVKVDKRNLSCAPVSDDMSPRALSQKLIQDTWCENKTPTAEDYPENKDSAGEQWTELLGQWTSKTVKKRSMWQLRFNWMKAAPAGNGGAELTECVLTCEELYTSACYALLTDMFKTTKRRQVLVKTKLK